MARKRKPRKSRGANLDAIAKAAERAATVAPVGAHSDLLPGSRRAAVSQERRLVHLTPHQGRPFFTRRDPRQVQTDPRRAAVIRAMEAANGRPIGRRVREKLQGMIPEVVRETICRPKRQKRAVMFATGAAGKGRRAAARRPRKQSTARSC